MDSGVAMAQSNRTTQRVDPWHRSGYAANGGTHMPGYHQPPSSFARTDWAAIIVIAGMPPIATSPVSACAISIGPRDRDLVPGEAAHHSASIRNRSIQAARFAGRTSFITTEIIPA